MTVSEVAPKGTLDAYLRAKWLLAEARWWAEWCHDAWTSPDPTPFEGFPWEDQ